MASSNAPRFLASGGDDYGLTTQQSFMGLVLKNFRANTWLWDNLSSVAKVKTLDAGNSHKFWHTSEVIEGEEHTPGDELLGQTYSFDDATIQLDSILVRHADIPLDQKLVADFDVVSDVAAKLGEDLAIQYDKRIFQAGILAARTAALSGFHNGGNVVEGVDASGLTGEYPTTLAGAEAFEKHCAQLARLMDEDNVPMGGRLLFISPYIAEVLGSSTSGVGRAGNNRDFTSAPGDFNNRTIGPLKGFTPIITNHLPSTNVTTGPTNYRGDFSLTGSTGQPAALALCAGSTQAPLGVVIAQGISTYMGPDERRNTTFAKAQLFMGVGTLAPYCAGEIFVDNA